MPPLMLGGIFPSNSKHILNKSLANSKIFCRIPLVLVWLVPDDDDPHRKLGERAGVDVIAVFLLLLEFECLVVTDDRLVDEIEMIESELLLPFDSIFSLFDDIFIYK